MLAQKLGKLLCGVSGGTFTPLSATKTAFAQLNRFTKKQQNLMACQEIRLIGQQPVDN
ncbi:MAG: hypothetical protein HC904_09185 [Blastochloris sp.]|nr:hypothetical protein [Blastochloris sp.]